jgi:outer membrane receptor protein involved in Fe transport
VLNTGVTYAGGGTSATLLFNVAGRRIVSAAEAPLPDVYELPRHVLDLSLRFPVGRGVEAKLDARNLLDEPYEVRQGDLVREYHRIGRTLSVGATLKR